MAIFSESNSSWFGAIIRNDKGEVMATMSAKGPSVSSNDEAELLACRKAMEFATDAGFLELVVERDNANVMKAMSSSMANLSLLGNVVKDVHQLILDLHWVNICYTRRGGNRLAHVLAQHARNISDYEAWVRFGTWVWVRDSAIFEKVGCGCGGTWRLKNY